MKIIVNNFQIEQVLDNENNQIEPESLQETIYWDIFCVVEALLYYHVKQYDTDKDKYFDYYPYRKRFKEIYKDSFISIDLDNDIYILRCIKSNQN